MDFSRLPARDFTACQSGQQALEVIQQIYDQSLRDIHDQFAQVIAGDQPAGMAPDAGCYPYVAVEIKLENLNADARASYGVALDPRLYGTTVTHPKVFASYYIEQLESIIQHHKVPIYVGRSLEKIPLPFADEGNLVQMATQNLGLVNQHFSWPDLSRIDDGIANNARTYDRESVLPLSLFSGERADYSLHRLHHYTGTAPQHFQKFILLTNYQRYVNEFIDYARDQIAHDTDYTSFVMPGNHAVHNPYHCDWDDEGHIAENLPQMPAYHLKRADGQGITFINIGVGPSNAKTITDHLAVLRPHCWLMLGHCAGLRRSQLLGDYVLAHAYVREDHVLDMDLPIGVPVPPLAEVQQALQQAVENITGAHGHDMKSRMRTGTVLTTDNRNWELCFTELFRVFQQSRAIAVDMESATIAANGFRFRVPYGTLLCVSDKPIHGEIKLRSTANAFYQERIQQHLQIGIEAVNLLRAAGARHLHSRKLRGFEEPPMR